MGVVIDTHGKLARYESLPEVRIARKKCFAKHNNRKKYPEKIAKYDAKKRLKIQEAYKIARLGYLERCHPENFEHILTSKQIEQEVERIIRDTKVFNKGLSLQMCVDDTKSKLTFYIGETKRFKQQEDLRFLTERGRPGEDANGKYLKNRPVLLHANGKTITIETASLYKPCTIKCNVCGSSPTKALSTPSVRF